MFNKILLSLIAAITIYFLVGCTSDPAKLYKDNESVDNQLSYLNIQVNGSAHCRFGLRETTGVDIKKFIADLKTTGNPYKLIPGHYKIVLMCENILIKGIHRYRENHKLSFAFKKESIMGSTCSLKLNAESGKFYTLKVTQEELDYVKEEDANKAGDKGLIVSKLTFKAGDKDLFVSKSKSYFKFIEFEAVAFDKSLNNVIDKCSFDSYGNATGAALIPGRSLPPIWPK